MLLFTKLAAPKAPKRRSRAGCTSCKERKKKCNEERPQCSRCAERGSSCVYEPVRPRQRRKRDSFVSSLADASTNGDRQHESEADDHGVRFDRFDACEDRLGQHQRVSHDWGHQPWQASIPDPFDDDLIFSPLDDTFDPNILLAPPLEISSVTINPDEDLAGPLSSTTQPRVLRYDEDDDDGEEEIDIGGGGAGLIGIKHDRRSSFTSTTTVATNTTTGNTIFSTDLTICSPATVRSPLLEFTCPSFSEFSENPRQRSLVDHFCNVLSHLIVFREETGNPFQQLVLPLMRSGGGGGGGGGGGNSPVADAVFALAGAHLEHRGVDVQGGEKSLYYHHRAIQGLAGLIRMHNAGANRNEVLAAIMLLIYYEVLVQRGRSNIVEGHLKGALTVMCSNPEPLDSTGIFLERAFRFYDVIAALSFGTAPLSTAPAAGCLVPFPISAPTATSTLNNVDSLLGMATTLWPIIHRLSALLPLKTDVAKARDAGHTGKVAVLRTEFETTVGAVEAALLGWTPNLPTGWVLHESDSTKLVEDSTAAKDEASAGEEKRSGSDSARLHSILNNALAYRNSALVYLYRTVLSHPRDHPLVQRHTNLSLRHCAATVEHQGPMGALLWPLFVAACEAATEADRDTARTAFAAIDKRQGMTNIERAWDIVQEVWRRAESGGGETVRPDRLGSETSPAQLSTACSRELKGTADMWRVVSQEMGVNIVFG
ncbi:hypothetical protein PpBr36_07431 [Pyricularia pennisetigena]|uniref:hypothetical protein n=1 Tax=Pyricularia pennisetigena TaxID=1578925 RepID=UPI00114F2A92|nr:hypothetical protein PpBr36_07431 [Pyricularia pennisetigena]TLS25565.1 hypothetical protein PpBr36_07431 [Pyricularia pennisetigena]